jgi:hypothetical protein
MTTIGARHFATAISVHGDIDNVRGKGYLIDYEFFESEEFLESLNFHDAIVEKANNGFFDLNHCNA